MCLDIGGDLSVAGTSTFGDETAGGGVVTIHGAFNTTDSSMFGGTVTINDTLNVPNHLTTLHSVTVSGASTLNSITTSGASTFNGTSDIEGEVSGIGITDFVNGIVSQHGSGTLHIHATATSPGGVTTPDGNPLVTHLPAGDDYREAISFLSLIHI